MARTCIPVTSWHGTPARSCQLQLISAVCHLFSSIVQAIPSKICTSIVSIHWSSSLARVIDTPCSQFGPLAELSSHRPDTMKHLNAFSRAKNAFSCLSIRLCLIGPLHRPSASTNLWTRKPGPAAWDLQLPPRRTTSPPAPVSWLIPSSLPVCSFACQHWKRCQHDVKSGAVTEMETITNHSY